MMAFDAFISHSSKDKAVADATCAALEAAGIRCWIAPRDVIPGHSYGEDLIDALDACRVMVLVFSASSNASPQIAREVERCVSRGVTIVPLRIDDVVPTKAMAYFVGSVHWLDAMAPPLEQHLVKLVSAIKACLPLMPAPEPAEQLAAQSEPVIVESAAKPAAPAPPRTNTTAQPEARTAEPAMPQLATVPPVATPETRASEPAPKPTPPAAPMGVTASSLEIATQRKPSPLAQALVGGLSPVQALLQLYLSVAVISVFFDRGGIAIAIIEITALCVAVISAIVAFLLDRRWAYITALVTTILLTLFSVLDVFGTDTFRIFPAAYPYLLGATLAVRLVILAGLGIFMRPQNRQAA